MIRTLSASGTFTQKYFFVAAWLFVFGDVAFIVLSGGGVPSPGAVTLLIGIFLTPLIVALLLPNPNKQVRMSDDGIFVSDNRREIFIPFARIESAMREPMEGAAIVVTFMRPTEFGDSIRFVPRPRLGFLPWLDPAVREFMRWVNKV